MYPVSSIQYPEIWETQILEGEGDLVRFWYWYFVFTQIFSYCDADVGPMSGRCECIEVKVETDQESQTSKIRKAKQKRF